MRRFIAISAIVIGIGAAAPAFANCTGHALTVQTPTTTTQTAQIPPRVPTGDEDR